jgi:tetratricopeptide (TPR) repeat protein
MSERVAKSPVGGEAIFYVPRRADAVVEVECLTSVPVRSEHSLGPGERAEDDDRMPRRLATSLLSVLLGCAGVTPDAATATIDALPLRECTEQERKTVAEASASAATALLERDYEAAEYAARSALELDPRDARARAVSGMVMLQQSARQEPPDLFLVHGGDVESRLAEQLAPRDPFVGWLRAVFLAEAGHMSAAAAAAEAALRRVDLADPHHRAALLGAAGTYRYELGEERAALPHLQQYVALRPGDASASWRLGCSWLRLASMPDGPNGPLIAQQQAESAAQVFRRCCELTPEDLEAWLAVATATLRAAELARMRGDEASRNRLLAEAVAHLALVDARQPASAEVAFRRGAVAEQMSDPAAARAAYHEALRRDPSHLGSLLNLAASLANDGERGAAERRQLMERALGVDAERGGLTRSDRAALATALKRP